MFASVLFQVIMNILLLGSGGRECALAWKLSQSSHLHNLWIVPGNAGTAQYGINVAIPENDFEAIRQLVIDNDINMIVVGPEAPLAAGIVDFFKKEPAISHIGIIGPSEHGAMLESSKDFAKGFMLRNNIPTAGYKTFTIADISAAHDFIDSMHPPYVLKADGLAQGKGVIICDNADEAKQTLAEMLENKKFGKASERVVIEEFLRGIELSVFVLTDGVNYLLLPAAKDYKRIGDGDTGPNTGGMGAVSPVNFADEVFMKKVEERILKPTILGIQKENIDYKGFIFFGLMNCNGDPYVIEYNVRLGDPETEAIIPRIENDFVEMFQKTLSGNLHEVQVKISEKYAVTVILASEGYPGDYEKGFEINGFDKAKEALIFHAGTKKSDTGSILTNGGRVMAVTALGETLELCREYVYNEIEKIHFQGVYYRKDIGKDLLQFQPLE